MKFLNRLLIKMYRFFALLALIVSIIYTFEGLVNGCGFFEFIFTIVFILIIYKILVPLGECFLNMVMGWNPSLSSSARPRRWVPLPTRLTNAAEREINSFFTNATRVQPSASMPKDDANARQWKRYQAKNNAIYQEYLAKQQQGTYAGYQAQNRAKQYWNDANK